MVQAERGHGAVSTTFYPIYIPTLVECLRGGLPIHSILEFWLWGFWSGISIWLLLLHPSSFCQVQPGLLPCTFLGHHGNQYLTLLLPLFHILKNFLLLLRHVFCGILLLRLYWKFRTGLKQSRNPLSMRILKIWVNLVLPIAYLPMLHISMRSIACTSTRVLAYWPDEDCWGGSSIAVLVGVLISIPCLISFGLIKRLTYELERMGRDNEWGRGRFLHLHSEVRFLIRSKGVFLTPYVYQPLAYFFSVTILAILVEALKLTRVDTRNIILSCVMVACGGGMTVLTLFRLPYLPALFSNYWTSFWPTKIH